MKLVNTTETRPTLTIEFTPEECDVLAIICAKVGGDVNFSPRKVTEKLSEVLQKSGYIWNKGPYSKDGLLDENQVDKTGIYFKNTNPLKGF